MVEIPRYLETGSWDVHWVHFCVHLVFVAGWYPVHRPRGNEFKGFST